MSDKTSLGEMNHFLLLLVFVKNANWDGNRIYSGEIINELGKEAPTFDTCIDVV